MRLQGEKIFFVDKLLKWLCEKEKKFF